MQRPFMRRGLIAWGLFCGLMVTGALVVSATLAQEKKLGAKPAAGEDTRVSLKIILPQEEDIKLWVNDKQIKPQTGTAWKITSSPLKPIKEEYFYSFKVTWEPNNYTTITRERRRFKVEPGKSYTVDLTKREKGDPDDDIVVRYVPTPNSTVDHLLDLAKVTKGDVVFDLGCGDGRMVCRAIAKRGAKSGVGVDIDPERIKDSRRTAKEYGVEDKVEWREGDVLKKIGDLEEASVVMLYMGDDIGARLAPILQKRLKPGTRVVSHRFKLGDWKPDKTITVDDPEMANSEPTVDLHLWVIKDKDGKEPAKKGAKDE